MHFQRGEDFDKAIPFLARAAETALQRAAHRETLDYANRGLELIQRTPAYRRPLGGRAPVADDADGRTGHAVRSRRPRRRTSVPRGRAVSAEIDDATLLGPVLYGLWNYTFNRGRMSDAAELSEELQSLARRQPDPVLEMQAHGTTAYNHVLGGRPATALPHLERCHALYDPTAHRRLALVYGEDPGVNSHQWAAYATWLLGYPDRARRHATEARELALNLGYPNDIAQATWFGTVVHILCRDLYRARQLSDALLTVCREYELTRWSALAQLVAAWMVAQAGEPQRASSRRCERVSPTTPAPRDSRTSPPRSWRRRSPLPVTPRLRSRPTSGALVMARRTGQLWYAAELTRLRGEILLRLEPSPGGVDERDGRRAHLRRGPRHRPAAAGQVARAARRDEPGPTVAVRGRDRSAPAAYLAGTYRWFTEGHETGDLLRPWPRFSPRRGLGPAGARGTDVAACRSARCAGRPRLRRARRRPIPR